MSFPSEEQKQAIYGTGNLIVSASAGAGKTAVLAERVLRLAADRNIPVERMLILTFTRAAASEMKTRIAERFLREAEQDPARAALFREQAAAAANANISTIDAFCSKIVFRHFFRAGLTPSTAMLDTAQCAMRKAESLSASLDAIALQDPDAYSLLVTAFGGDGELEAAVKAFGEFLSTQTDPEGWLSEKEVSIGDADAFRVQLAYRLSQDKNRLLMYADELSREADALDRGYVKVLSLVSEILSHARGALIQETREEYAQALCAVLGVKGNLTFPKGTDESEKKPVQEAKKRLFALVRDQYESCSVSTEELFRYEQRSEPVLKAFYALVRSYLDAYAEAKRARNEMDFSDLEHLAIEVLKDDEIAAEYRERFLTIFVDEYQDSNRIQEAILSRIARKDALFYVGDVKQSIYRFRKAEPDLFLEKCEQFCGAQGTRIDLAENFRSGQAVIDAVNEVFSAAMRKPVAGIDYDARAMLKKGNPAVPDGKVELHVVERDSDLDDDETMENVEAEARFAAGVIRSRMERPFVSGEKKRACRYADFAVLLRSKTNARVWVRTFTEEGIPCYASAAGGYFEAIEVRLVMSLLEVLDNRRQDIPLLAVMRSPLFGFTDERLSLLRIGRKKRPLLDCLLEARETEADVAAFLDTLDRYVALSRRIPLADLIERILDETHYRELVGTLSGGEQRVTNLSELVRMAAECDAAGVSGIHGFLHYMIGIRETKDPGESSAVTADVVRIMTVHGSKGLQFPFVFYAELGKKFNTKDEQQALICDPKLGAGLTYLDEYGVAYETLTHQNTKHALSEASWAEELRVMYVAMTRAEQELYLCGSQKNASAAIEKLGLATMVSVRAAKTPLQILLLTLNGRVPFKVHMKSEFTRPKDDAADRDIDEPTAAERDALLKQFDWVYPHPTVDTLPDKTSVTGLSKDESPEFTEPAFEIGYDAMGEGSAVHRVLERIPLHDAQKREAYLAAISGVTAFHAEAIRRFAASPLFLRMTKAERAEREWSFLCPMPANALLPEADTDEPILLQGVIDACFIENGAWVLLDYKTDRVMGDPREYAKKHTRQVALYADALSKLSGIPVGERHIVLLGADTEVEV